MAIVAMEDILNRLDILNKDDTKDLYVSLLEDITDSFGGNDNALADLKEKLEEAERKISETEEFWRNKYIERFKGNDSKDSLEDESAAANQEEEETVSNSFSEEELIEEWKK